MSLGNYPRNTVAAEISKYMGNAVKIADIWGTLLYNVKATPFLAKGDGVTDDTASIQAAINAAYAAGGGQVFFPVGTYLISPGIILKTNVSIYGVPNASIIKAKNGFATSGLNPMIWADTQSNVSVHDLVIDGNGLNQSGTANIVGVGGYKVTQYSVSGCLFKNVYGIVCEFSNCIYVNVTKNHISTNYTQPGIVFVADTPSYFNCYSVVEDNIITGIYADAISLTGSATGNIKYLDVVGNVFYNNGFMGNNVDGAAVYLNYASNCTIDGNVIDQVGGNAIDFYIGKNVVISDNVVSNVGRAGIMLDTVMYSQVIGNNVTNCVQKGASDPFNASHGFLSGLYVGDACQHLSYINNISTDNQVTKTQQYGLLTSGTTNSNILISGNDLSGNAVSAILFNNPVTTCFTNKNIGYNPVGNITSPAIPTSGTNYTNAFPYTVRVFITGGPVGALYIGGVNVGVTGTAIANGIMVTLEPSETIKMDYTVAPTWKWFGI